MKISTLIIILLNWWCQKGNFKQYENAIPNLCKWCHLLLQPIKGNFSFGVNLLVRCTSGNVSFTVCFFPNCSPSSQCTSGNIVAAGRIHSSHNIGCQSLQSSPRQLFSMESLSRFIEQNIPIYCSISFRRTYFLDALASLRSILFSPDVMSCF